MFLKNVHYSAGVSLNLDFIPSKFDDAFIRILVLWGACMV